MPMNVCLILTWKFNLKNNYYPALKPFVELADVGK
jgi:hypothetical protein